MLVATGAALSLSTDASARAHAADGRCGSGVTVVVDANELGGDLRAECAEEPDVASVLFEESGFSLEYQPQLQDFVCKVDGLPTDRRCTDGDSYWSLWWAAPGGEWAYATLGVSSLEIPAGGSVAFAWHQGEGDASPPDIAVGETDTGDPAPGPVVAAEPAEDDSGFPVWAAGGLVVVVLGAALVAMLLRRRAG